jgi:hypothetical protein
MKTNLLLISQIGFAVLTIACLWMLLKALKTGINKSSIDSRAKKRLVRGILLTLVAWLLFVSVWSLSGIMSDFNNFPLNFAPVIVIPLVAIIATLFSKRLGEILGNIQASDLIRLQSFRFFVELLLWALFAASLLPEQMTFEGRNFDILAGITAPLIAWLITHNKISRMGLIIWNFACLALLINIVAIAILSTPSPIRIFMKEPANTIVTVFPISWLPGFLVPLAYTLHLYSLKQLFSKA